MDWFFCPSLRVLGKLTKILKKIFLAAQLMVSFAEDDMTVCMLGTAMPECSDKYAEVCCRPLDNSRVKLNCQFNNVPRSALKELNL